MSDFIVNPFEKPQRPQIKLSPVQVEAIRARSAVRHGASELLAAIAEKTFPETTAPIVQNVQPQPADTAPEPPTQTPNVAYFPTRETEDIALIRQAVDASFGGKRAA